MKSFEKEIKLVDFKNFHDALDSYLPYGTETKELLEFLEEEIIDDYTEKYSVITCWEIYEKLQKAYKESATNKRILYLQKVEEQLFATDKMAFTYNW